MQAYIFKILMIEKNQRTIYEQLVADRYMRQIELEPLREYIYLIKLKDAQIIYI